MTKTKKPLSILLSVLMILSALPFTGLTVFAADPENNDGYSIFVHYDGLDNDTAAYASVYHDFITEPYYVIPENSDTVKEDLVFNGFYCTNTGKMVQIGESVPLTDFTEKEGAYHLYLSARFSEKEKPGVTYTDIDRYCVTVNVQYPDDPYAYLEDPEAGMLTFGDEFEDPAGQNVGTVAQPRQLMLYARMGLNFMGYRSLLTGNVFETGDTLDANKLPEAVYVGQELQETSETEGYRISVYEITDYVEPIFEYLGAVGGFLEPLYECTVNYYTPVEPAEDEGTTGDPLQFFAYEGSEIHTLAMLDLDTPMELTCQPEYMEDLGYVFDGYGALDDDEITYPDGLIFMDQYSNNDNAGNLTYYVKLHYTETDEETTEEELLAAAKEKISARYQAILDDDTASESKKVIASAILADIANAADRNEMKEICRAGEANIRLQDAKDMAIAEVTALAPDGNITDEMQAILDSAVAAIQASDAAGDFEDIISEARSEINRLLREEVNADDVKDEMVEIVEALADENSSDTVKAIVAKAVEDIELSGSAAEIADIALGAVKAVAVENVESAAGDEQSYASAVAAFAVTKINNAQSIEDVNTEMQKALDIILKIVDDYTFTLSDSEIVIGRTGTATLTATFPEDITGKKVTWSSTKPEIASVNEFGIITGNQAGVAMIKATAENGCTVYCAVKVVGIELLSGAKLNHNNGFITGLSAKADSLDDYITLTDDSCKLSYDSYATDSILYITRDGEIVDAYTLVVTGDVNGDGVCDVLDVADCERAANEHTELAGAFFAAGDLNESEAIDATDYSAIVNAALA